MLVDSEQQAQICHPTVVCYVRLANSSTLAIVTLVGHEDVFNNFLVCGNQGPPHGIVFDSTLPSTKRSDWLYFKQTDTFQKYHRQQPKLRAVGGRPKIDRTRLNRREFLRQLLCDFVRQLLCRPEYHRLPTSLQNMLCRRVLLVALHTACLRRATNPQTTGNNTQNAALGFSLEEGGGKKKNTPNMIPPSHHR